MKRFIRTLTGKITIFILCILMQCIFISAVIGAVALVSLGGNAYLHSEEGFVETLMKNEGYAVYAEDISESIAEDNNEIVLDNTEADNGEKPSNNIAQLNSEDTSNNIAQLNSEDTGKEKVYIDPEIAYRQERLNRLAHFAYGMRYGILAIGGGAFLLSLVLFIALMCVSGRRPDTEELVPGHLYRVPFDLMLAFGLGVLIADISLIVELCDYPDEYMLGFAVALTLATLNLLLGICMSAAARIKGKSLVKNTIIFRILKLLWRFICLCGRCIGRLHRFNMRILKNLKLVWKVVIAWVAIVVVELLLLVVCDARGGIILIWFIKKIILIPITLYISVLLTGLRSAGRALAQGETGLQVDTRGFFGDFRRHAEDLNNISRGIAIAVEERLSSERMKTQLITNVSHDIKTPLTSIINYGMLIGQETSENPRITEYSEVIVKQSQRLKRLIEDLIEASRASTGNLEVCPVPCNAALFISQTAGEYEEKLEQSQLTLVSSCPKKEIMINADGRRMWRIFDNVMNNICKYSMTGTRVYVSLTEQDREAVITFKNTSREPLNLSEEELMERFVRGDSSRNTEGSGLGLSIAKSLVELQGGKLELKIDGDLFKVILSFPII